MSYEMNDLLELVVDQKCSDLHLQVGVRLPPLDEPDVDLHVRHCLDHPAGVADGRTRAV